MREEKTFRVVVFRFETDASTNYTRYIIFFAQRYKQQGLKLDSQANEMIPCSNNGT